MERHQLQRGANGALPAVLAALTILAACSGESVTGPPVDPPTLPPVDSLAPIRGEWHLSRANGTALPYVLRQDATGRVSLTGGTLTIPAGNTFSQTLAFRELSSTGAGVNLQSPTTGSVSASTSSRFNFRIGASVEYECTLDGGLSCAYTGTNGPLVLLFSRTPPPAPPSGVVVFDRHTGNGVRDLWRVDLDGGNLFRLTSTASEDEREPAVHGSRVLFASGPAGAPADLYGLPLVSTGPASPVRLTSTPDASETAPALNGDGTRIAYVRQDGAGLPKVWAVAPGSSPAPLMPEHAGAAESAPAWTNVSASLRLAFVRGTGAAADVYHVTPPGSPVPLASSAGTDTDPAFSPDGSRAAFVSDRETPGATDLYTVRLSDGVVTRLTTTPASEVQPAWTADGKAIVFVVRQGATTALRWLSPETPGDVHDIPTGGGIVGRPAVAEAGQVPAAPPSVSLRVSQLAEGLLSPTSLAVGPGGRIFVTEAPGAVRVLESQGARAEPFANFLCNPYNPPPSPAGCVRSGGADGLLRIVFNPRDPGTAFVYYTNEPGDVRVDRIRSLPDGSAFDTASRVNVLTVDWPFPSNRGGALAFGPDGLLYIGLGDGGSGGDPMGNGQNPAASLGKVLRLDVAREGAAPEVWASGVRNVAGLAFGGGLLWLADRGQRRQEVNAVPSNAPGLNYGWNRMDGGACFRVGCDAGALVFPVRDFATAPVGTESGVCEVVGGFVYAGAVNALRGLYIFGDRCTGAVRAMDAAGRLVNVLANTGEVSAVAEGPDGEIIFATHAGRVYAARP